MDARPSPEPGRQSHDGSIGGVSRRIGYDVRELLMMGCSHAEIAEVEAGLKSLDELLASRGQRRDGQS